MTPQELEAKFAAAATATSFWTKAHGKLTAVLLSFAVGFIIGWVLFHGK
jgi:hypothetical protein